MGNFFGVRRRTPIVTAQDRAILQLKQQRDKIKIYQKRTEAELEKNKELAIRLYHNNMKERALVVLRRKKCMEEILSKTDTQLYTLEQLVNDIEYTQIEVSVVEGLKVGTEALKQLNSLMSIDDIQQMIEDNEEAAQKQREISDILQGSTVRYDENDLLKELENYAEENREKENVQKEEKPIIVPVDNEDTKVENDEEVIKTKLDELPNVPKQVEEVLEEGETYEEKIEGSRRQLEPAQ